MEPHISLTTTEFDTRKREQRAHCVENKKQFAQAETAHSPCLLHNSRQHHLQHNPFSVHRSSLCAKHHDMFHEGWLI
jgi:hypothetical protein